MHPSKAIRKSVLATLAGAGMVVGDENTPVSVLQYAPAGGWPSDDKLPAAYVQIRSEKIEAETLDTDRRSYLVDVILQAKGSHEQAQDHVDDMALATELVVSASNDLGGLVMGISPVGSEVHSERGEAVFSARRLTFETSLHTSKGDPSVTI
jgi:hypothetical protein